MKKIIVLSLFFTMSCAGGVYRHKADANVPEEKLVKVYTWNANIKAIDKEFVYIKDSTYGIMKEFFLTEGKHEIQVEFKSGRKVSRSYKTVSLEGKPGEAYMICSITNAERELFSDTYSGTWTAFVIPLKESKMSSGDVHNVYKGQCMSAENMQRLNKAEK